MYTRPMRKRLGNLLIVGLVVAGAWLSYTTGMTALLARIMMWTAVVFGIGGCVAGLVAGIAGTRQRARAKNVEPELCAPFSEAVPGTSSSEPVRRIRHNEN